MGRVPEGGKTGQSSPWCVLSPPRPQILLAAETGPGGIAGLDDLIMSNHCTLVPGDLPKALPRLAQGARPSSPLT